METKVFVLLNISKTDVGTVKLINMLYLYLIVRAFKKKLSQKFILDIIFRNYVFESC